MAAVKRRFERRPMKLASYNLENLFERARAMSLPGRRAGRALLLAHAEVNGILTGPRYTAADQRKILKLLAALGLARSDESRYAILRQNRGALLRRPRNGRAVVVARGRGDWIGWVDLKVGPVLEAATRATAKVIDALGADVLAVMEVEDRPALLRFSQTLLRRPYAQAMVIDGNDDRGIDVGLLLKKGYALTRMKSHADDTDKTGRIFSRDCVEHFIRTPKGTELVLLVNHFKSQGFGAPKDSHKKRARQANRTAEIYRSLLAEGHARIAVVGDLNDEPGSPALRALLEGTNLRDASEHPAFDDGGSPATFGVGAGAQKLDYLLLSPALFRSMKAGGIFRRGLWDANDRYPEIKKESDAASDHAAVWAGLEV